MKNDVVRWSNVRVTQSKNNSKHSNNVSKTNNFSTTPESGSSSSNSSYYIHLTRTLIPAKTTTSNATINGIQNSNKCDTIKLNENSIKLTHNNQLAKTRARHYSSHSRHWRKSSSTSRARAHSRFSLTRSTFCEITPCSLSRVLFICLQLSAVVFLCSLNIGFVSGVEISDLPYELDYEQGAGATNSIEGRNEASGTRGGAGTVRAGNGYVAGDGGHYTHTWAVHIPKGDEDGLADQVARDHGFVNLGKIFDDHYHFAHHRVSKRSLTPAVHHQSRLDDDSRVHWSKQQKAKSRRKRDFIHMRPSRTSSRSMSLVDAVPFDDPKWPQMWYLNRGGGLDMNVIPAWKSGITGKGIVVTILDDGLESDHPDIEQNYDPKASYDVNGHDNDPMPHYDMTDSNRHGTRCAGEVAATANNSICAVGIAYGASVGGVRMLDGDVTDAVEARSLSLNPQHIDIYSASWGPDDDGKTVDGPGELASRAFIEGTTKGRNGKGSIFIWASGNGGRELDNCNCDGYTNSIWTLSISSATEEGHVPWYSEKCSSTLATTYSSGGQSEKQVVTTDLHHSCTVSHTGTSASAPLAAGIAALVLESNQNLTWRDLQHIVVRTAKPANLRDPTWSVNGVGRRISHSFGYGLMDAAEMVKVARTWKTVPEQQRCEINAPHVDKVIPPKKHITLQLTVKHCLSVNFLEHVQAKITLTSQRRGDIQLYLRSPAGTKVTLLTSRVHDVSRSGFNQWPFMSVHSWGESPHGNWQLEIHNEGRYMAQITQWDLIFYGTETPAQPDDPVQLNPGQFSPYGNDMEHNDIEFDVSGQWHNMQQVGESSVAHDRSNTAACLKWSDQRCLVCAAPTYLYKDHCYDDCPPHTYPVNSTRRNHSYNSNELSNDIESAGSRGSKYEEVLQAQDRRRRQYDGNEVVPPPALTCAICDASCQNCYGPLNSQCSSCYPGSQLRKQHLSNEAYCYVYAERSSGNIHDVGAGFVVAPGDGFANNGNNGSYSKLSVFLTVLMPMAAVVAVITALVVYSHMLPCRRHWAGFGAGGGGGGGRGLTTASTASAKNAYTRVALLASDGESDEDEIFSAHIDDGGRMQRYRDDVMVQTEDHGLLTAEQNDVDLQLPTIVATVDASNESPA